MLVIAEDERRMLKEKVVRCMKETDSLMRRLAIYAPCPVLIVPRKDTEEG
jgi:hypothetical protein